MTKFTAPFCRFAFGWLLLMPCALVSVSYADEEPLKLHKNVTIGGVYGAMASIQAIDAEQNKLKLDWSFEPLHATELFLSEATQFKIQEQNIVIGDIKVGDVLLDIRNRNAGGKGKEAYFFAQALIVKSLDPLTLTIQGPSGGVGPSREQKPGETPTDLLIEDMQSDEVRGIGRYFPQRGWRDEKTGQWKDSNTLIVPQPENMVFTRSVATAPLKISDLSVGQRISFDATVRPDGEMNGLILWTIKENSPKP